MNQKAPKYIGVYQKLKAEIMSGKYPGGSFLPVEDELVKIYSASRTTIRHAISLLRDEKFLDVRQGRGTEVLPIASFPNDFRKFRNASKLYSKILVEGPQKISAVGSVVDMVPAEINVARALSVEIGSTVYRLQKLQTANDLPFAYMVHYLRCDVVPGLEQYNGKISNLADFVKKVYDIKITSGEETISASAAGFVESRMLNIEIGSPILTFHRISHYEKNVFEYGITYARPDLFELIVTINDETGFLSQ